MEPNQDGSEVLETTETEAEQVENTDEGEVNETDTHEDIEALKAQAAKAEELEKKNKQLFERLKKQGEQKSTGLSAKDFLALKDANISADDFDDVQNYASFKKVSIADALSDSTMKAILADRADQRRTAQATQTRSPRGATKVSGEDILAKMNTTGEMPEANNKEALSALFAARTAARFKK